MWNTKRGKTKHDQHLSKRRDRVCGGLASPAWPVHGNKRSLQGAPLNARTPRPGAACSFFFFFVNCSYSLFTLSNSGQSPLFTDAPRAEPENAGTHAPPVRSTTSAGGRQPVTEAVCEFCCLPRDKWVLDPERNVILAHSIARVSQAARARRGARHYATR